MISHEKDIEYFTQYPAPLMELIHRGHYTNVNATITFFGPMLYFFARAIGAEKILEIGHAEGYTARYLASAVKDNGVRYGMAKNMYYGLDIVQTEKVHAALEKEGLPHELLQMDSALLTPRTYEDIAFDIIFQDGCHDALHVLHELNVLYPQLKGQGQGYWIFHDCYGPAEDAWIEVEKLIKAGVYEFELVRIIDVSYGIAIMRKMEGYDTVRNGGRHEREAG